MEIFILFLLIAIISSFIYYRTFLFGYYPRFTEDFDETLEKTPFLTPEEQKSIEDQVHIYHFIPQETKEKLFRVTAKFLKRDIEYIGEGLEITKEVKLNIASQAALLLLNNRNNYFAKLKKIILEKTIFQLNSGQKVLGLSYQKGLVVLALDNTKEGISNFRNGNNVVLHELAHQLDQIDGFTDGIPSHYLEDKTKHWAKLMQSEYKKHVKRVNSKKLKKQTLLTPYAATNMAEFFAVSTEMFFEKPKKFKKLHPRIYLLLKNFYNLDPDSWNIH